MSDFRLSALSFLQQLLTVAEADLEALARQGLAPDCLWDVSHPINRLEGIDAVLEGFVLPLRRSLTAARRRDEIFMGASNRLDNGGDWVAAVNHYVGNFTAPLVGIAPHQHLLFLRSGEFYRVAGGKIVEAKIIVDFLDVLRQVGRFPLPRILGTEMLYPGPATHDGVLPVNRERSDASLDLVKAMLTNLTVFDPETFQSSRQTGPDGFWHEDMLWYGPAGIGVNYTYPGFEKDHRIPFLQAFPDRAGGEHGCGHYCHIGDGDYAAVGGWPSMRMTHTGEYLGVAATGKALTLRVMDFYRCAHGKIMENWVYLDYLDLFQQMGVDLLARAAND